MSSVLCPLPQAYPATAKVPAAKPSGRFLKRKGAKEPGCRLQKELRAIQGNCISVRFEYEWRDEKGQ